MSMQSSAEVSGSEFSKNVFHYSSKVGIKNATPPPSTMWISIRKITFSDFLKIHLHTVLPLQYTQNVSKHSSILITIEELVCAWHNERDFQCQHFWPLSSNYRWTFKKHDWNTGRERVWQWFYTLPLLKITVEAASTCKNTTNVCALHAILFELLWTLLLMGFHSNWKTTHSIYIITMNIFCQRFLFLNKSYKNLHILDWKEDPSHPLTSEPA